MYRKSKFGFTIVELLIVIVVIGILAAITIVAYNGIQVRANNTKTINSVTAWAKAIKLYNIDNDSWPTATSCLGGSNTYDTDGKCWSAGSYLVNSTFLSQLAAYMSTPAEPSMTKIYVSSTDWIRGGRYNPANNRLYYVLENVSTCPQVSGTTNIFIETYSKGIQCGVSL